MKIIASIFLFSIAFSVEEQDEIGFLYGILGHLGSNDDTSMVLQDSSIIHTGDEIRINAGYKKDTHFYVIYQGSEGEYMLLYPEENGRIENVITLGRWDEQRNMFKNRAFGENFTPPDNLTLKYKGSNIVFIETKLASFK